MEALVSPELISETILKKKLAFIADDPFRIESFLDRSKDNFEVHVFANGFKFYEWINKGGSVEAVISTGRVNSPNGLPLLKKLRSDTMFRSVPFIFILEKIDNDIRKKLIREKVSEIFDPDFSSQELNTRLSYLIECSKKSSLKKVEDVAEYPEYKLPLEKRIFDIVFASLAIICLSPLFILVAILIRFESRGPITYSAKRVGTGYKVFDFYKFRSMYVGADQKLKDMAHLNQYKKESPKEKEFALWKIGKKAGRTIGKLVKFSWGKKLRHKIQQRYLKYVEKELDKSGLCDDCKARNVFCQSVLYLDGKAVCESRHIEFKKLQTDTFVKISNDPRVTRIGKFIRNTSIDELPQLFNVLKGDMSIVGNRPLPLYEAEKITTDQFNLRFMAPAGITGLWQVTKRGTSNMSEEERMQLDNEYAKNYSLSFDIKIILKTIPALLQKENV